MSEQQGLEEAKPKAPFPTRLTGLFALLLAGLFYFIGVHMPLSDAVTHHPDKLDFSGKAIVVFCVATPAAIIALIFGDSLNFLNEPRVFPVRTALFVIVLIACAGGLFYWVYTQFSLAGYDILSTAS